MRLSSLFSLARSCYLCDAHRSNVCISKHVHIQYVPSAFAGPSFRATEETHERKCNQFVKNSTANRVHVFWEYEYDQSIDILTTCMRVWRECGEAAFSDNIENTYQCKTFEHTLKAYMYLEFGWWKEIS